MPTLLIIDDDPGIPAILSPGFRNMGIDVFTAGTASEGLSMVTERRPDAVLLDIGLPDQSGLEVVKEIIKIDRRIPTVLMTGQGTIDTAIKAMKLGAFDYVHKPFAFPRMKEVVGQAFEVARQMRVPVRMADEPANEEDSSHVMVGRCDAMQEVFKMIGRVAPQNGTVLIRGESGTGKELVARAIYQHSHRAAAPFLAINCAAIPETLLESELFGHEKGAFTSADHRRIGKFEQCSGGTLFLDEVGDMTPLTQTKVLRVLQDQRFERVGGTQTIQTDTRTIFATHRPLEEMVAEGTFREDLYYRLNVFTIHLPALRERIEDLPLLVNAFVRQFSREMRSSVRTVAPETMELLTQYRWPGNVRELQMVLKQALLHAFGPVLLPKFLPPQIQKPSAQADPRSAASTATPAATSDETSEFIDARLRASSQNLYAEWFARVERQLLVQVLQFTGGNQVQASKLLGITRRSLRGKILTHGIAIERSISHQRPEDD